MNTIRDIRFKYDITNIDLSNVLGINKSTISTILDRDINTLSIKQLCSLREYTKSTFNELLGEQVFTPDNIDNQTDNTKHTSLSDNLVIIEENEIHLHPKFAEAVRKAIQDNKE